MTHLTENQGAGLDVSRKCSDMFGLNEAIYVVSIYPFCFFSSENHTHTQTISMNERKIHIILDCMYRLMTNLKF